MRVARVIGNVTLNRCHPSFLGAHLKLVVPLNTLDLSSPGDAPTATAEDTLVAWDRLGTGVGNFIALAEGPEAANPFLPEVKPVDAYAAGVLDQLEVDQELLQNIVAPARPDAAPSA